ncbi:hypothetical protein [Sulfurovum sp. NBC37-1]|uniref:hypothetical protein n=1 Tax=Sulfurovum sp. (strain NBC37-1) TaxID=387093 RepID=UPI0001587A0A|nr:hypothetical protein [Sulfurovum sp. NBC37-1]BAF72975.1 hypothetical protein SUN_2033 [Sulfurovum sp. NBC37-1]
MRNYQNILHRSLLVFMSLFIFLGCQQPMLDSGETKFKKLSEYHLSDFGLGKNVRYFEIVRHGSTPVIVIKYGTKGDITIDAAINNYSNKRIRKTSWDKLMKKLHAYSYGMMFGGFYTVRYIDSRGESFAITQISELKHFLGLIDTPAKLQMWFYLSGTKLGYSYKKEHDFYIVRWDYQLINDTGMCTKYRYRGIVDIHGKVIKRFDSQKPEKCPRLGKR